ncbi:MAG: hypothetical protein MK085_01615 [Phycisphaerales bacterium]|nr:hypothetical protein [Phycisphaerales bacterium]
MSSQSRNWLIVLLILGNLLVIRWLASTHGFGLVYVKEVDKKFVEVAVPPLAPPVMEDGEAEPAATDSSELVTEWLPADSPEVADFATEEQRANPAAWKAYEKVPPREYWEARNAGNTQGYMLSWFNTIGLWVAVFFTLAIFSFLFADNPAYKVAEATVVGVSAAYWMAVGFWDQIVPNLIGKLAPGVVRSNFVPGLEGTSTDWWYLIPAFFGVLMLMRLSPKGGWLSLWTLAFIVGTTAALRLVTYIETDFLSQITSTIIPFWQVTYDANGEVSIYSSIWASIRNITLVVGVLSCLTYFFFSVAHKGVVGGVARLGIWFLMITFGAAFGFTVMGRIALLAARFEFLFDDWLWFIDPRGERVVAALATMLGC